MLGVKLEDVGIVRREDRAVVRRVPVQRHDVGWAMFNARARALWFQVRYNPNVGPTDVRVLCIRSCRLGKPRITSHSFLPTIEPPPLITDGGEQKKGETKSSN